MPVRVSLCMNSGKNRGKVNVVVVLEHVTWQALVQAVKNKLRLKKKELSRLRLFIHETSKNANVTVGTELDKGNVAKYVENGSVLSVSAGEDYVNKDGNTIQASLEVALPPRYPFPKGGCSDGLGPTQTLIHTVFCDLDGVLADFDKGVSGLMSKHTGGGRNHMWDTIGRTTSFFDTLPKMENADLLWSCLVDNSAIEVAILTGCPKVQTTRFAQEKRRWCEIHLGTVQVLTCLKNEKCKWSGPGHVLIDDDDDLREAWENRGGIFIHHQGIHSTLNKLQALGLACSGCPPVALSTKAPSQCQNLKSSRGKFPIFRGVMLNELRKCLRKYSGFVENVYDTHISFDYNAEGVQFPDTNDLPILFECRGLLVCPETGKVLARRLHKFFNINENGKALATNIDTAGASLYEKLDGTLVSPFIASTGELLWASRRAVCPVVEAFVQTHPTYKAFAETWITLGFTPLFEWITAQQPVGVLTYPEDSLVLFAIRSIETGEYVVWEDVTNSCRQFSIPLVKQISSSVPSIESALNLVRAQEHCEGAVLVLGDTNTRYKIKSTWYLNEVKGAKYGIKLGGKSISKIDTWNVVLATENGDDLVSLASGKLSPSMVTLFVQFVEMARDKVKQLHRDMHRWAQDINLAGLASDNLVLCKNKARQLCKDAGWEQGVVESYLRSGDEPCILPLQLFLLKLCRKGQWEKIKALLLIKSTIYEEHVQSSPLVNLYLGAQLLQPFRDDEYMVIIVRGLPGSGKSTFAVTLGMYLEERGISFDICSADRFFESRKFSPCLLREAHEFCRNSMETSNATVRIIDNTNSTLGEYAWYLRRTSRQLVFEMACDSQKALKPMTDRCVHDVSYETVQRMHARWEFDPQAIIVRSGGL
mmetsp:Transcript_3620/g.6930  ORF Transcript_3620/g.6930 Transcript_3620/m.6930 type:complete len:875 (+) Transcript_3620:294-2918(+)